MELSCTYSKMSARVDDENKITENNDRLHIQQYGNFLVDDSFMIPNIYTVHENVNREWTTDINVGSNGYTN